MVVIGFIKRHRSEAERNETESSKKCFAVQWHHYFLQKIEVWVHVVLSVGVAVMIVCVCQ